MGYKGGWLYGQFLYGTGLCLLSSIFIISQNIAFQLETYLKIPHRQDSKSQSYSQLNHETRTFSSIIISFQGTECVI